MHWPLKMHVYKEMHLNKFTLCEYSAQYNQSCINLILGIQIEEFAIPITLADQPDLQTIETFYQQKNGNFWVALHGDEVLGTIALIDIGNKQVALRKMFVAKAFRGNKIGVAKALLDTTIAWCKQKQVQEIFLGTTAAYHAAHRFYEKNHFFLVGRELLPKQFPIMAVDSKFYRRTL